MLETTSPAAQAAAIWSALCLLLLVLLSVLVVRLRQRHRVGIGDGGEESLARAVRAFGNASEYIPAGLAALALLVVAGAGPTLVHLAGAALFIGRVIHALGLSRSTGVSPGRAGGMVLTWLSFVVSASGLVFLAIR